MSAGALRYLAGELFDCHESGLYQVELSNGRNVIYSIRVFQPATQKPTEPRTFHPAVYGSGRDPAIPGNIDVF